jgi:hypothetical protein
MVVRYGATKSLSRSARCTRADFLSPCPFRSVLGGGKVMSFVFHDTIGGPRVSAVKAGRVTQAQRE